MNEKGIDRRVRKTQRQLRLALAQLMRQKPVQKITVRELADLVDINRATFYLHYRDVFDLLRQIEEDLAREFNQIIETHQADLSQGVLLPLLRDLLSNIRDNADLVQVLLSENGDISFINRLKDFLRTVCLTHYTAVRGQPSDAHFEYSFSYMVSGCIGLLQRWLDGGMPESCDEMAMLTEQLILHGTKLIL